MSERLYVVMNRMLNGQWMIADFWDMPFVSTRYLTACKMRREIEGRQAKNHWKYKKSKIVRLAVKP